ncbi:MAG TPA: ComEC/Rec2 family competence protein, partial [Chloroflexota bacterium]|nr:ComEC/Rec2 family competence protein [Chloroflexota bacterium]
ADADLVQAKAQIQGFTGLQEIRGLVADDPVPKAKTTSLTLSEVQVKAGDTWQPLSARVLLSVPPWPEHDYGEYLQLRGRLQALTGDNGVVQALQRQGVLGSMSFPKVSYLANPQANPLLIAIFGLRQRLGDTIARTLPDPAASTLRATLLGLRSALPKEEQQALVDTGTVHLVVISGFKLSLLAAALEALGLWFLRRTTASLSSRLTVSTLVLAVLAAYTVMTGASPSAVRAAIMAGLVVVAALAGRPRDQVAALALAVLAILAVRPLELDDGGFQLSCLSVLGIAILGQPLSDRLRQVLDRLPHRAKLPLSAVTQSAAVSVAATAFTLPVVAGSFHIVSLISPVANLLGMPLLSPIVMFGGVGALLGSLVPPLGTLLLWPAWAFTTLLEWVVRSSAALPDAALPVPDLPPPAIGGYFVLLLVAAWFLNRRSQPSDQSPHRAAKVVSWAAMSAGAALVTAAAAIATRPPAALRTTFLAVPGQAALIQTPAGRKILIDGGQDGSALLRQLGTLLAPWDRNIDLVLVTSSRTDHVAGLDQVFARYTIGGLIGPDLTQANQTFQRLQRAVQPVNVDTVDLGGGAVLRRAETAWQLQDGAGTVTFQDAGAQVVLPGQQWRIVPMLPSIPKVTEEDVLSLADTGNVTITF